VGQATKEIWSEPLDPEWTQEEPPQQDEPHRGVDSPASLDFAAQDLSGQDFSGRNLAGANFFRARLRGVNFADADLTGAEFTGADLREACFERANAAQAGFGMADLRGARFFEANLQHASFSKANLEKADLRCAHLTEAKLREANLRKADFSNAQLIRAELSLADVKGAAFNNADLRGARLRVLRNFHRASWIGVDIRDVNFAGAYRLRRFIIDQNFLKEFRESGPLAAAAYFLWKITSNCGRSMALWFLWILFFSLAFGIAYQLAGVDYGDYPTWLSPFYYSVVTLTTLGYGDVVPKTPTAQAIAMLEVMVGYLMLGGLLSIMSNKFARRGE